MKFVRNPFILMMALLCLCVSVKGQENVVQTIRGSIVDKGIQGPIPYSSIWLVDDSTKATTCDEDGKFKLTNVPVGRHYVKITSFGYKQLVLPVLVTSGKEVVLTVEMEEEVMEMEEIVIKAEKDKDELNNNLITNSGISLRPEEINRFAGSRSDPSRMASNYAGVAGGGDLRNDIIVRGNSPQGVLWRLEGVDIPNPNHFSFTGNTGGAFSILNNNLLANSDFLTGAFPAEYGNKTAAVFDVRLRKGNNEKREHTVQVGLNGLEAGTEGPLNKKGASYLVNGRFLTFEALKKLGVSVGANGIPQFQDGVVKFDVPTAKAGTFSVWAIGGNSSIFIKDPVLDETSKFAETTDDFKAGMYATGISNTHFYSKNTAGKLTLSVSGSTKRVKSSSIYKTGDERKDYNLFNREGQYLMNYTLTHKFNSRHLIKTGVIYRDIHYNNTENYLDTNDNVFRTSWDKKGNAGLLQLFTHWQFNVTEKLTLNNGLYYQRFMLNNTQSLEPRVAAIYQLDQKNRLSLATGMHSQALDLFVYQAQFYDSINGNYYQTNKDLKFMKSWHLVGGYQRSIGSTMRFKTEAYIQHLYNVPVDISSRKGAGTYSSLNNGADYSFYAPDSLVSNGTGRNIGLELTLERYFTNNFYFLTNLSLINSTYKGSDKIERNTAFNVGHVFNFLAGKEFHLDDKNRKVISVDMKVTHSGGRRTTAVDVDASLKEGHEVWDYSTVNKVKLKNYFRTDLKIAYNNNRPNASHQIFIAADNIFNTQNVLTESWDNDKKKVTTYYQMGVFPYLGYRVQF